VNMDRERSPSMHAAAGRATHGRRSRGRTGVRRSGHPAPQSGKASAQSGVGKGGGGEGGISGWVARQRGCPACARPAARPAARPPTHHHPPNWAIHVAARQPRLAPRCSPSTHQCVDAGGQHELPISQQEDGGQVAEAAVQQAAHPQRRRALRQVGDLLQQAGGHGGGCWGVGQQGGMGAQHL
jgi:hypothetical protein